MLSLYLATILPPAIGQSTLLENVQDCANKSIHQPFIMKEYTCTDSTGVTLDDSNLSTSLLSYCSFSKCGTMRFMKNMSLDSIYLDSCFGGGIVVTQGVTITATGLNVSLCKSQNGGSAVLLDSESSMFITSSTFRDNVDTGRLGGGAIFVKTNSILNITASSFINNTAYWRGGSIYMSAMSNVSLQHVHFKANRVISSRGGDIFNQGGTLSWNYGGSIGYLPEYFGMATQGPSGGSIGIDAGSLYLNHLKFENQRVDSYGAVLHVDNSRITVRMNNISTLNTQAGGTSGVMHLLPDSDVICAHCQFINAYAKNGAGSINTGGKLVLLNVTSQNSTVYQGYGSFLLQDRGSDLTMMDCFINGSTFIAIDHQTPTNFGALTIQSTATLLRTTVSHSRANVGSALAYINNSPGNGVAPGTLSVIDSVFMKNTAARGGGAASIFDGKTIWKNVRFQDNSAYSNGGAMEFRISDRKVFTTTFLGTFECYSNTVQLEGGSGGCLTMNQQTAFYINTTELFFIGNKASYGSDVFNNCDYYGDGYRGLIEYNPPANATGNGPRIEGTWYFYTDSFAAYIAQSGVLDRIDPNLKADSRPVGGILKDPQLAQRLNGSSLTIDLELPAMEVMLTNVFRKPVTVVDETTILMLTLATNQGVVISKYYRVILSDQAESSSTFKSVYFTRDMIPANFDGVVTVSFAAIKAKGGITYRNQTSILNFLVPSCDPETHGIVPLYIKPNGKTAHACLPTFSVSTIYRRLFLSLSIVGVIMASVMGIVAHAYRQVSIYRTLSAVFTNLITIGCGMQLVSVIIRSLASISFQSACMISECLELLGFTMVSGSIVLKTRRIRAIFLRTLQNRAPQAISNTVLLLNLGVLMVVMTVLLATWIATYPLQVGSVHYGGPNGWIQVDRCTPMTHQGFNFKYLTAALHILFSLVAVYFAHICRNVPSAYNESKSILIASYGWIMGSGVMYPISEFVLLYPDASFILLCISIVAPCILTLCFLHVSRMITVLFKEVPVSLHPIHSADSKSMMTTKQTSIAPSSGSFFSSIFVGSKKNSKYI